MINCTAMQLAGWVVSCSPPGCSSSEAICELWLNGHFLTHLQKPPSSNRGTLKDLVTQYDENLEHSNFLCCPTETRNTHVAVWLQCRKKYTPICANYQPLKQSGNNTQIWVTSTMQICSPTSSFPGVTVVSTKQNTHCYKHCFYADSKVK